MKKNNFATIILAAGYSSRMGDFKPLLKFGEYTTVETVNDECEKWHCKRIM